MHIGFYRHVNSGDLDQIQQKYCNAVRNRVQKLNFKVRLKVQAQKCNFYKYQASGVSSLFLMRAYPVFSVHSIFLPLMS